MKITQRLLILILFAILIVTSYQVTQAAIDDVQLEYLGTEVLDTNGQPEINNVYYVHCDRPDYVVYIEITFTDNAVQLLSGEYCGTKIYIVGSIVLVQIVQITEYPEPIRSLVYLPIVTR